MSTQTSQNTPDAAVGPGRRSRKAADITVLAGRTDITNMTGGLEAWQAAGLPVDTGPAPRHQEPA